MPKWMDDLVKKLVQSKSFQKQYEKLKRTKSGFAKKFKTLRDWAWSVAQSRAKEKKKAADISDEEFGQWAEEASSEYETDNRIILTAAMRELTAEDALAEDPAVKRHKDMPGRSIFILEVAHLGVKSKHRFGPIRLSAADAKKRWKCLVGMPVYVDPTSGFSHHFNHARERMAIGSHIAVHVTEESDSKAIVTAAAAMWAADFAGILEALKEFKSKMGASYEILADHGTPGGVEYNGDVMDVKEYTPVGSAIVRRSNAAHPDLRLLAADGEFEPLEGKASEDEPLTFIESAKWSTAYKNSLPNSSFALVKDKVENKATDRALPYKDKNGKVSLAHVRNALARLNQVKGFSSEQKARAKKKLENVLKRHSDAKKAASVSDTDPSSAAKPMDDPARKSAGGGAAGKGRTSRVAAERKSSLDPKTQILEYVSEEHRAICATLFDNVLAEAKRTAAHEAAVPLNEEVGKLTAERDTLKESATRLNAQLEELNRAKKDAEQASIFAQKMQEFVKRGYIREEDTKEAEPLVRKLVAEEAFTSDEALQWGKLAAAAGAGGLTSHAGVSMSVASSSGPSGEDSLDPAKRERLAAAAREKYGKKVGAMSGVATGGNK